MLSSETFPLNVRIILLDPFSGGSSFYVVCVCGHCCWKNQNLCSMLSLTRPVSCISDVFFFLSRFFFFDLLELVSFDKLDFFNESDNDGSGSGSPGKSVDRVSDVGFGNFFPTGIDSIGDVVPFVVFIPRGVESKVGQLIGSFWRPKS